MIPVPYFLFIAAATAVAWWLSGYDSKVTGEDKTGDFLRRAIRCGITLILLTLAAFGGFAAPFIFIILGVMWASCGAELFSRQFHKLVDPEDRREFDPKKVHRDLDRLAKLTQEGRNEEALVLCQEMETSGEASPAALEATLHQIYEQTLEHGSPRLVDVQHLREAGQFAEAASQLEALLAQEPENWSARLVLMRIYGENLSEPDKAARLLESPQKRTQLHPALVRFARHSIERWRGEVVEEVKPEEGIESLLVRKTAPVVRAETAAPGSSLNEMLAKGRYATAIEHLEQKIAAEPENFESSVKLAEVYAIYCADISHAAKIVREMAAGRKFTPEQMDQARAKLRDWERRH